jgi:hypothetical protein
MHVGKTLFSQVMEFVPWTSFGRIVDRYKGNAGVRKMSCAEQFRVMAFAQLTWRESLRDIEVTLGANASKLYAMGFRHSIHRSTLADANESRDWRIWCDVAALLIRRARKLYSDTDLVGLDLKNTVYALDATTIDLCLSLFEWAPFRKAKGAIKLHTLLDLRGAIPAFMHISDGKLHEVNVLDFMPIEAGAFYVMDRGYLDFKRLYKMHCAGGFFVTCANNNFVLPPLTIAALYKNRWQVELFFKWIKQHLRIKKFLGNSENAVKTQIWCAVSSYVRIAIVKKELQIDASLYTLLQILSVSVFEKTELSSAFQGGGFTTDSPDPANQLNLFDI